MRWLSATSVSAHYLTAEARGSRAFRLQDCKSADTSGLEAGGECFTCLARHADFEFAIRSESCFALLSSIEQMHRLTCSNLHILVGGTMKCIEMPSEL